MRGKRQKPEPPRILSGWKDIANYLRRGVRTVQRYERDLGLPVRRPAGRHSGSVVATKAELDAWVSASPIREGFRLTRTMPEFPDSTAAAMQSRMEQMRRLRDQMETLQNEVRRSVYVLRENVQSLRADLKQEYETVPPHHSQTRFTN